MILMVPSQGLQFFNINQKLSQSNSPRSILKKSHPWSRPHQPTYCFCWYLSGVAIFQNKSKSLTKTIAQLAFWKSHTPDPDTTSQHMILMVPFQGLQFFNIHQKLSQSNYQIIISKKSHPWSRPHQPTYDFYWDLSGVAIFQNKSKSLTKTIAKLAFWKSHTPDPDTTSQHMILMVPFQGLQFFCINQKLSQSNCPRSILKKSHPW